MQIGLVGANEVSCREATLRAPRRPGISHYATRASVAGGCHVREKRAAAAARADFPDSRSFA